MRFVWGFRDRIFGLGFSFPHCREDMMSPMTACELMLDLGWRWDWEARDSEWRTEGGFRARGVEQQMKSWGE